MTALPNDNSHIVGDLWTFVNVLPESRYINTVHTAKRNEEEANKFIKKVKENSNGQAPLFSSDGFYYSESLYNNYSTMHMQFLIPEKVGHVSHKELLIAI